MKIIGGEVWVVEMALGEPYAVAYEQYDKAINVFLRLETDCGLSGFGIAAPDEEVTGETIPAVQKSLEESLEAIKGQDAFERHHCMSLIEGITAKTPSAKSAINLALYDLLGKKTDLPVWKLLGGTPQKIMTSMTIGILPLEETIEHAIKFVKQGFLSLKIKGGLNPSEDIARICKVREAVGPGIDLRFDANQGYSVKDTLLFAESVLKSKLTTIEQPVKKNNLNMLGEVTRRSPIPIMADECIVTLKNVRKICTKRAASQGNIKITKVGGLDAALVMDHVFHAHGIPTMVGCMDESALGIAAGLTLALCGKSVKWADLDGHIDLLDDPAKECCPVQDGHLMPWSTAGFGLHI
jgi:L-Ala-D/L-Glu epimerase / N-acetyl-D-glutamate racemase